MGSEQVKVRGQVQMGCTHPTSVFVLVEAEAGQQVEEQIHQIENYQKNRQMTCGNDPLEVARHYLAH